MVEFERADFYTHLVVFLREIRPEQASGTIADDGNLFDLGLIDSVSIVELILFVENLLKLEIRIEELSPQTFHTMSNIYDGIVAKQSVA